MRVLEHNQPLTGGGENESNNHEIEGISKSPDALSASENPTSSHQQGGSSFVNSTVYKGASKLSMGKSDRLVSEVFEGRP